MRRNFASLDLSALAATNDDDANNNTLFEDRIPHESVALAATTNEFARLQVNHDYDQDHEHEYEFEYADDDEEHYGGSDSSHVGCPVERLVSKAETAAPHALNPTLQPQPQPQRTPAFCIPKLTPTPAIVMAPSMPRLPRRASLPYTCVCTTTTTTSSEPCWMCEMDPVKAEMGSSFSPVVPMAWPQDRSAHDRQPQLAASAIFVPMARVALPRNFVQSV